MSVWKHTLINRDVSSGNLFMLHLTYPYEVLALLVAMQHIVIFFFFLLSSTSANVVAIDNKIEQAMVSRFLT